MITASLAAIPERKHVLPDVIDSLYGQVDKLFVCLNGWDHTPKCLFQKKIRVQAKYRPVGDAGKFFFVQEGYCLTCDDDLFYEDGYVKRMVEAVDHYERRAVVSMHGRLMRFPTKSYYRDRREVYHCLKPVPDDVRVHVVGTGVLAWHSDAVTFTEDDFPQDYPNMADIHVSVKLERLGIPRYVVSHTGTEIRHLPIDTSGTIFNRYRTDDSLQTKRANSVRWERTFT